MAYDPTYEDILTGAGGTLGAPTVLPDVTPVAPAPPMAVPVSAPVVTTGQAFTIGQERPLPAPAAPTAPAPEPVSTPQAPASPAERETRNMVGRAGDLLFDTGPAKGAEPSIKVGESESVERGVVDPETAAMYGEAGRIRAAGEAGVMLGRQAIDQNAARLEIEAMKQAEQGFVRLAKERDNYLSNARATRDRMLQISNENANRKPAKEGILEGKTEEGKIATVLGVLMMAVGAGMRAKGGDMSGAQQMMTTLHEMSQQAVREQRHAIEMGERQYNMLGNDLQQHLANLGDLELATKAAEADFFRKASIQAKQYAVDFAPVIGAAEAQAMVAQIEQQAIERQAALLGAYGDKVKTGYQTQFTMPMRLFQQRAQASQQRLGGQTGPGPAALPNVPQAYDTPEGYFGALTANAPTQPIDPAVAAATGYVPPQPPPAAPMPGAASAPVPAARPAAPEAPKATHTDDGTELAPWQQLMIDGRYDEAVGSMPPKVRQIWAGRVKRVMDDARFKGDRDAAIDEVFGNWRNTFSRQLPAEDERSRIVTSGDRQYLATTPRNAEKTQEAISAADNLIGSLEKMKRIASKYGDATFTAITPEDKSAIEALGNSIASRLSLLHGQGAMMKWDENLWASQSGKFAGNWWRNPLKSVTSAIDTTLGEAQRSRTELLTPLQPRNQGDQGVKPREVK